MRDPVVWLALLIIVGTWGLFLFGVIDIWITLPASFGSALLLAWNLDRTGRGAAALERLDQNRPDFYGQSGGEGWSVPTAYIDHPTGTGPPPGVEQYDEAAVERLLTDRGESSTTQRDSDPAP